MIVSPEIRRSQGFIFLTVHTGKEVFKIFQGVIYQPIVERTGTLFGYEALHDSPFNARLFDGTVQSLDLERKCFEEALIKAAQNGLKEKLFINFSLLAMTYYDPSMAEKAFLLLDENQVVLEIAESFALCEWTMVKALNGIQQARKDGFLIAIDDFGKGNSIALLDLEPDYIKIDRDVIKNCYKEPRKESLIRQIASWQAENLTVIAEGIENERDLKVCQSAGIHYYQGFYIGRPGKLEYHLDAPPVNRKIISNK